MEALKIRMKIESDTVTIPELSRFIGKRVEIILLEDLSTGKINNRYSRLRKLKGALDFDNNAFVSLREKSTV